MVLFSNVFKSKNAQIELERVTKTKVRVTSLTFTDANAAKELVERVVTKFGRKGVTHFVATVEAEPAQVLLETGFRQCGVESLWEITNFEPGEPLPYRPFENSDAEAAASLYNEEIVIHFHQQLERSKKEFHSGFILETAGKPVSYLTIENGVIEFSNSNGYELDYDAILSFACAHGGRLVKLKSYTTTDPEDYLRKRGFERISEHAVLAKDFYKPIKQTASPLGWLFGGNKWGGALPA